MTIDGLTAATLLLARSLKVTVYAKEFPPQTTSNKAGGQWAQPNLQYLFAGHHGYLFPRKDCVVVGGSEEMDATDPTPDMNICRAILANMKGLFTGGATMALEPELVPSWAMRSK